MHMHTHTHISTMSDSLLHVTASKWCLPSAKKRWPMILP